MIKHIVMWKLKDGINHAEVAAKIKAELEGLEGKIEGLSDVEVCIDRDPSGLCLISTLKDWDALAGYRDNPYHVAVADTYVRPFVQSRQAVDYEY